MPNDPNTQLCFQVPYEHLSVITANLDELGLKAVTSLSMEDLECEEPQLFKTVTFLSKTINIPENLIISEEILRQSLIMGAAVSYFTASYCRQRPYERYLSPLTAVILLDDAEKAAKRTNDLGRFFVSCYTKDYSLQTIFSHLDLHDSSPNSVFAQIGGGTVSYFLNEFEARCRQAPNN